MKREEGAGYRHARLEGLILQELRTLMRDEVSDPALSAVQLTRIVLSVDYRHARVHFGVLGRTADEGKMVYDRKLVENAMLRATPFLRAQLALTLDLKRVPDLRFVFDAKLAADDA